jgi:hypothetical protein
MGVAVFIREERDAALDLSGVPATIKSITMNKGSNNHLATVNFCISHSFKTIYGSNEQLDL